MRGEELKDPIPDAYKQTCLRGLLNVDYCVNLNFATPQTIASQRYEAMGVSKTEKVLRARLEADRSFWDTALYRTLLIERGAENGKWLITLTPKAFPGAGPHGETVTGTILDNQKLSDRVDELEEDLVHRVGNNPRELAYLAVTSYDRLVKSDLFRLHRAYLPGGSLSYGEKAVALGAPPLWVKCIYGRCVTHWRQYAKTPADKERVAKLTEKCLAIMKKAKLRIPKRSPYAQKDPQV